jgi:hypothetical protein
MNDIELKIFLTSHDILVKNEFEYQFVCKIISQYFKGVFCTRSTPINYPEKIQTYSYGFGVELDTSGWIEPKCEWEYDLADFIKILRA